MEGEHSVGMKPNEFFDAFVLGNLNDCRDDPGNLRKAFNAAVSASHVADHHFYYHRRHNPDLIAAYETIGDLVEMLSIATEGAFRDIRSIANAYKHLYTSPKQLAHSTILSGGSLIAVTFTDDEEAISKIEDRFLEGATDNDHRSFVQFTRKDGSKCIFLPCLEKFVEYWSYNFV